MSLDSGLDNVWSSDYVQINPTKAYKVKYKDEYTKVAAYLNGGPEPNWQAFSKLGKGLCEIEEARRLNEVPDPDPEPEPDPDPVPDPAPPGSIPMNRFAHIDSSQDHEKYINRWDRRGTNSFHNDSVTGPPWPGINGPAVIEQTVDGKNGFKFICTNIMSGFSDGAKVAMLSDQEHIVPPGQAIGKTFRFLWDMRLPSAGNPNGWFVNEEFNCLFEWVGETEVNNQIGVNGLKKCFYVRTIKPGGVNGRIRYDSQRPFVYDKWYKMDYTIKFAYDGSGYMGLKIDDEVVADHHGQTFQSGRSVKAMYFGCYSLATFARNEVDWLDMKVIKS